MAYIDGQCHCKDRRDCWHDPACVLKGQLRVGTWILENPKGYIRVATTDVLVFEDGEYEAYKNPNVFRTNRPIPSSPKSKSHHILRSLY